jgi:hypothetical protein
MGRATQKVAIDFWIPSKKKLPLLRERDRGVLSSSPDRLFHLHNDDRQGVERQRLDQSQTEDQG